MDQSLITPLAPSKGYAGLTATERCMSCGTRNPLDSAKHRHLNYHPHRDILDHVVSSDTDTSIGIRKYLAKKAKKFFPDITDTDSIASSPKTSASLVKIRNREQQLIERIKSRPNSSDRKKGKGGHHHYHIHTHHHYPQGVNGPSVVKTYTRSKTKPAITADTRHCETPQSRGDGIPFRAAERAKKTSISRPCTARKISNESIASGSSRRKSSTNPPGTAESLPRISGTPKTRKNSTRKNSNSYRPVSSVRKYTYGIPKKNSLSKRKNTPAPTKRKITPPKKLSDTSNPVISTNNPGLHKNKKQRLVKSAKPRNSKKVAAQKRPRTAKQRLSSDQNVVVHSEVNLIDKIIRARKEKGYPTSAALQSRQKHTLGVDEDDGTSPMLASYSNFRDRVDIYIGPHAPAITQSNDDAVEGLRRQRWFPQEGNPSKSTPSSPLRSAARRGPER